MLEAIAFNKPDGGPDLELHLVVPLVICLLTALLVVSALESVIILSGAKRWLWGRGWGTVEGSDKGSKNENENGNGNSSNLSPSSCHHQDDDRRCRLRLNDPVNSDGGTVTATTVVTVTEGEEAKAVMEGKEAVPIDVDVIGVGIGVGVAAHGDCETCEIGVGEADEDAMDRALPLPNSVMEGCTMDM